MFRCSCIVVERFFSISRIGECSATQPRIGAIALMWSPPDAMNKAR